MSNHDGGQLAPAFQGKWNLWLLKIEWDQETGSASPLGGN